MLAWAKRFSGKTDPMKTFSLSLYRSVTAVALLALGMPGWIQAAPPEATQPSSTTTGDAWGSTKASAQAAVAKTREAFSEAWEKSKDATLRQREAVRKRMAEAEAVLDTRILEWTAKKDAVA